MPLVTLTTRKSKSLAWKDAALSAVHRALVASGVPESDLFHRVIELASEDFRFDPHYPDTATPRTGEFVLVEIVLSVGRSVKVKRKILADLVAGLRRDPGIDPENVMVVFEETQWENWSFAGGRLLHVG
ncbi:MAG TPA: tautomerase family protein [Anaeromyxobacteraceae bacterium]|nr:tautomerase family protein [Anaeromyxobacteraceae bacterium]